MGMPETIRIFELTIMNVGNDVNFIGLSTNSNVLSTNNVYYNYFTDMTSCSSSSCMAKIMKNYGFYVPTSLKGYCCSFMIRYITGYYIIKRSEQLKLFQ